MDNIDFKVYKREDYNIGQWMGGTTTELSIFPKGAKYSDRQFIWRLSSASVEIEESTFTKLPEYDRVLIVLENEVILVHKDERVARLAQYEQDRFDGGYDTISFGKILDFNLMVRKGNYGLAEVITLNSINTVMKPEHIAQYSRASETYYCTEGFCVVSFGKNTCMLNKGELLVVNYATVEIESFQIMGEGKVIRAHIYFNEEQLETEIIPQESITQEKASFRDVLDATKICYTNFRGSKYIFKGLKDLWYDDSLQKAIDKLESTFLVFLIFMMGLLILPVGVNQFLGLGYITETIIIWLVADVILINPLLYFVFLPKPIAAHIKKIDSLTEHEKLIYEKQKKENKKLDKLLKKYEITGRNVYKDK